MQYGYVNGLRMLAAKGLKGACNGCGTKLIAKCGDIKIHHWAHASKKECDPWWENETEWHREWKDLFPETYREVVIRNSTEFHRADIRTGNGLVIEFQNSQLSLEQMKSREEFYKKLIWVLNGKKFKGFKVSYGIPDPEDNELKDYEILGNLAVSYLPKDQRFWPKRMRTVYQRIHPRLSHIKISPKHDAFKWKYIHKTWSYAKCPVLIDLGGHFLYEIKTKKQDSVDFLYLKKVSKNEFINAFV